MRQSIVVAVFWLIVAQPAFAQWVAIGKDVPDKPWQGSNNGFGAALVMTKLPFLKAAIKRKNARDPIMLPMSESVVKGDPVVACVVFAGWTVSLNGTIDITVDYRVLKPDGTEYANFSGVSLWKGAPPLGTVEVGDALAVLVFDPPDPIGEYSVQAHVCDRVSKKSVELVRKIVVKAREE